MLINLTPVQNFLARKATEILAGKLKTRVSIDHVRIDLLNHVLIRGLYIEDKAGDTLLYAGEARVRITDWFIIRKTNPVIHYIGLHDAYGHLYRTDHSDEWNYQFIVDAFDTGRKDSTKKQNEFELDLEKVDLRNVRFHMDDAWVGSDYDIDLGNVQLDAEDIDIKKRKININSALIEEAVVSIRDYDGGRPPVIKEEKQSVDTTAFNTGGWAVSAKKLILKQSAFHLNTATRAPYPDEFDPSHMGISDIHIDISDIRIIQDTIRGYIKHLSAKERCGLQIKKMTANVTVSPNASICEQLYLETNNSKLQDYYAMRYTRFPDFTDYIHKVIMEGNIVNSRIDTRDVAYFAPVLRKFATVAQISGQVKGTVDNLTGTNLFLTDGSTFLKGNIIMQGLPDIHTSFINFQKGEFFISNNAIFRYAPEWKKNTNIAVEKIRYAHYRGNFAGYISNFAANGTLATNLGTLVSDIKLNIPELNGKRAVYSGTVTTAGFDMGTLLRMPLLGSIAFRAGVNGAAFDPLNASVKINGTISHFEVKGYRYQNIIAEGTLARKKFTGNLLVDDPSLALAFYGDIDFSQPELNINAKANLLKSDLKALNLTTDSVLATADFDLNFIGNDIDNFSGYAKLYNINLLRNNHRVDIDSVSLASTSEENQKLLILESNDVTARIKGDYQLSTLHRSVQFYIAGYLPNYIIAPTRSAPDQNLSFSVNTREVDSLFAVLAPSFKGFGNAKINGSLNTAAQQLSLKANIPYGYIDGISLHTVSIDAIGNFRDLLVNANVENFVVGNDILSASMAVNTRLGNDSLNFSIATKSPDVFGTLSMNGHAYASGDSLYLSMLPSEFFLNQQKWEIPAGNRMVFSKDYLMIRDLMIRSDKQEITAHTAEESTNQSLFIKVNNVDASMLGNLAGLAEYEPAGKINGTVSFEQLFKGMTMEGSIQGSQIRLGVDTIGSVNLIGSYNAKRKIITLDPQSGIYNGSASIRAAGSMSLDSTDKQVLNGYIAFNQAKLTWISPVVRGFLSKISGVLNGTINIGGSASRPDISGELKLADAGTRIDVIGPYYKIPSATLKINNDAIDLGTINITDVNNRTATLTGGIAHDRFRNMRFSRVNVKADELEVLNLKEYESNNFYGNLVAHVESMSISGSFDDIRMTITASPAQRSNIYIPIKSSSDIGSYSYVSFKTLDTNETITLRNKNKFSLTLIGKMNPLAEMTLVLDPSTGDMINARGNGVITLNVPSDDDIKMYGNYEIEEGDYTFTLRQLAFRRNFIINAGSKISFNGLMSATNLSIDAIYTARARLIDLLNERERDFIRGSQEEREAKIAQDVRLKLHMSGSLNEPKLTFNVDLLESRGEGTLAYQKLKQVNQNDRELFDQVASLLLIGTFIPPEGIGGSSATSGAINNISEVISSTASSQLTNIVNKLLGDPNLSLELGYKNYNLSDPAMGGGINRNEVSFGIRKNLLDDRLVVELGSAYDWGRPTASNSNTSNLNLAGDFRVQYLLTADGRVRLNAFRTSNYDVLVDQQIWRGGVGISYRKRFNNLMELLNISRPALPLQPITTPDTNTAPSGGTW